MTVVGQAPDYNYTTFEVIGSHTFDHVYDYAAANLTHGVESGSATWRRTRPPPGTCAPNDTSTSRVDDCVEHT